MHVGMSTIFQNPHDRRPDHEVYAEELRLAALAEPLGYESVWGVEHNPFFIRAFASTPLRFTAHASDCFNPFFIRAFASTDGFKRPTFSFCFNPFFIRAFASTYYQNPTLVDVRFQSLLHQGIREHR